jgi:hypothetical protein
VIFFSRLFQYFNQLGRYIAIVLSIVKHEKTISTVQGKLKEEASNKACDMI